MKHYQIQKYLTVIIKTMNKYLDRKTAQEILNTRPTGTDVDDALKVLGDKGYIIEGYNDQEKTGFLGKAGQFGKDILGGTVQSFEMTGKTVQAISQATGDYLGHKAEYEKQGISFEDVRQAYLDKLNQDVGLAGRISKNTPSYAQDLGTAKGIEKTIGGIGSGLLDVATLGQGKAFTTGAKAGIKALTKESGKIGAGYGAAEAMKQGEDIQGVAGNTLLGGALGTGLGLAGGTAVKRFNKLKSSLSESVGKLESVFANVADKTKAKLNPKKLNELTNAGVDVSKIDVDTFNNAMKRGYEIDKAYNLSQMTSKDKQIAQKTLDAVEKYNIDKTSTIPADIIGKNFIDKLKPATKLIKETGKEVEEVAKALKGQNNTDREILRQTFNETLQESGITGFPGNWQFSGKYEFVPELQTKLSKTLNNIYIAIQEGDDYALHNLKKGIDEVIDYSRKSNEGLSGSAENLFKNLRRQVDGVLDTTYRDYNEVNSKYSQLRTMSDELLDTLGIDLNDLNEGRATNALRGAFSNRAKRTEIRDIIANLDEILEKNGIRGEDESLLRQFLFNEMLENQYGTQALTSLKGEVEKGVKGAMSVARLLKNPLQGAGEIAGSTVERIAGQTDEDRIKFLKEFLKKEGLNQAAMPKNSNKLPKLKPNKGIVEATLPESALMNEAKKYKSAEEFVDNFTFGGEGSPLMHGTNEKLIGNKLKVGAGNIKKGGQSGGLFLTDNPDIAQVFGKDIYYADKMLKNKVLDLTNFNDRRLLNSYVGKTYKTYDGDIVKFTRQDLDNMLPNGKADFASISQYPELIEKIVKENGLKGVAFREYAGGKWGKTFQFFEDEIPVYSKSQLTDIWNKAQK